MCRIVMLSHQSYGDYAYHVRIKARSIWLRAVSENACLEIPDTISSLLVMCTQVVIHPAEASKQPQYYGVTVDKKAKHADYTKAAMLLLGHKGRGRGANISQGQHRIWNSNFHDWELGSGEKHIFFLPKDNTPPCKEGPQASPVSWPCCEAMLICIVLVKLGKLLSSGKRQ